MNIEVTLEKMLDDYDWQHAFSYADGTAYSGGSVVSKVWADEDVFIDDFHLADVAVIFASSDGENDSSNWLALGKLKDGRYFYLSAGCDYTGWD